MNSGAFDTLIFDWDGTLYDSAGPGLSAFFRTFEDLGVSRFTREFYNAHYSPNWYSMYEALELPRESWERADELWLEHYRQEPVSLIAGAYDTVKSIAEKGYRLAIVTSGTQSRVARELLQLGLTTHFEAVICKEDVAHRKPHPEGLETAISQLKAARERCAYIGDAPEDIQMGKGASVLTVAVRSSYPTSKHLAAANPDILIESITELVLHF